MPLFAGIGMGVLNYSSDRGKESRDRGLQAATARYSPWTGMKPQAVHEANAMGDIGQGALSGYQMGQAADQAASQKKMADSYSSWLDLQQQPMAPQIPEPDRAPASIQPQAGPVMSNLNPMLFKNGYMTIGGAK